MKRFKWQPAAFASLVILSALIYLIHYAIFRDARHVFIYMITDLAFLPIEVLLVTMIIHQLLTRRETKERLEKLNMVIGVFFSEMGTSLLVFFSDYDPDKEKIRNDLAAIQNRIEQDSSVISKCLKGYEYGVDVKSINLKDLRDYLAGKRDFLIRLLENPMLLEHESFADLLWAVLHLMDELTHREDFKQLPESDLHHLRGDIKRAYTALVIQWIFYMKHLKESYPYLFSLAIRTNPFDRNSSAIVRS